jgi:CRP-like cAMP-binding protein
MAARFCLRVIAARYQANTSVRRDPVSITTPQIAARKPGFLMLIRFGDIVISSTPGSSMSSASQSFAEWKDTDAAETIRKWHRLLGIARTERFKIGERLLQEGAEARCLYLLEDGIVKLSCTHPPTAGEAVLGLRFPGDLIGAPSVLLNLPHLISATSILTASACRISQQLFRAVLEQNAEAANFLIQRESADSLRMSLAFIEAERLGTEQRFVRLLWRIASVIGIARRRGEVRIPLRVNEREFASLLGILSTSFSKLKKRLILQGLLAQEGSSFVIDFAKFPNGYIPVTGNIDTLVSVI